MRDLPKTDPWTQTITQAVQEAQWLRPVALTLFCFSLLLVSGEHFTQPNGYELRTGQFSTGWQSIHEYLMRMLKALPAFALAWVLWDTQAYLKKLEQGHIWSATSLNYFRRIGESLLAYALLSSLMVPTIQAWTEQRGPFKWHLESSTLILFGLGLFLMTMARLFSQALATASTLKTDSESII